MPRVQRKRWMFLSAGGLALAALLAFLYVQSQRGDDSNYYENVGLLRQLKQVDAQWELDVLRSRMGINADYDSLVNPLVTLTQLRERLQDVLTHRERVVGVEGAFNVAIAEKTRLVEHFKSHNSILHNSLAFLPTAANDVGVVVARDGNVEGPSARRLLADVNEMLLLSMVYSHAPTADKAAEIQSRLYDLDAHEKYLSPEPHQSVDIFASHVSTVLREQPVVSELLKSIAAIPVAARVDDLDQLLSEEQQQADRRAQEYRRYLLILAVALAALLLYAAVNVVRSHAIINRVNRELHATNATLERRVEERTRDLRAAQSELLTTARRAGMAEIASNVLHNVGNVLNSVNISAGVIGTRMRESKVEGLAKAVGLLNEHAADLGAFLADDERGRRLPGYLNKLVTILEAERRGTLDELGAMTKSIDHIKDIVATQQSYAGTASVVEVIQIQDLVEDALRMNAGKLARHQIAVIRDLAPLPAVPLDKSRVLQILVNLISNAAQALEGVADRTRQVFLRSSMASAADGQWLRIVVTDNGEGIKEENMARLFVHGFTTRKTGHGFGLHSCALAAKEMGGAILVHSDGPSRGAAFTLELPVALAKGAP